MSHSSPAPANGDVAEAATALPPESTRTTLTILIILHLFALAVAVLSNAGPVSPLRGALRKVPLVTSYLQFLHMDLAYNYHLISRDIIDDVVWLELEPLASPANEETDVIRLPDPELSPGIRRQRLRNYVREIVELTVGGEVDPGQAAILPAALSKGLLQQAELPPGSYRLRLVRQGAPELETPAAFREDATPETLYEANLFYDEGEVGIVPVVSEEQRARVRQP